MGNCLASTPVVVSDPAPVFDTRRDTLKHLPFADNVERLLKIMKDMDLKVEDQTRLGWWLAVKYPVVSTALMSPDNPIAVRTRMIADKMKGGNFLRVNNGVALSQSDESPPTRYNSSPNLGNELLVGSMPSSKSALSGSPKVGGKKLGNTTPLGVAQPLGPRLSFSAPITSSHLELPLGEVSPIQLSVNQSQRANAEHEVLLHQKSSLQETVDFPIERSLSFEAQRPLLLNPSTH